MRREGWVQVWHAKWAGSVEVAVKSLKRGTTSPAEFKAEAAIMKKLAHPNLVKLYAVCSKSEPLYIVTEFMERGSLLVTPPFIGSSSWRVQTKGRRCLSRTTCEEGSGRG